MADMSLATRLALARLQATNGGFQMIKRAWLAAVLAIIAAAPGAAETVYHGAIDADGGRGGPFSPPVFAPPAGYSQSFRIDLKDATFDNAFMFVDGYQSKLLKFADGRVIEDGTGYSLYCVNLTPGTCNQEHVGLIGSAPLGFTDSTSVTLRSSFTASSLS